MNKILFAAVSALALGVFGCAADATSPAPETKASATSEALHHASVVGEFQHCGGFIQNAPVCASGLKCQLGSIPDSGGICVKTGVGASCGGFINPPPTCDAGLVCHPNLTNPDKAGTCGYANYNESCGGFTANPIECGNGLECSHIAADGTWINPDWPGVCLEGAGSQCGGNMTTAKACAGDLTCVSDSGLPVGDVGGTCQ
jgi:hypothetical protein